MKKYILCLFFLLVANTIFLAQIVNIEDKRSSLQDTAGIFGFVDLGLDITSNTQTTITTKGSVRLDWIFPNHHLMSISNGELISANKERFVNQGFQHLRYNYHINPWLTWEGFGQIQYNEKIRVQFRGLAGTGPRFRLYESGKQKIYLGTLYMFEHQVISDTSIINNDHRISSYISMHISPKPFITLAHTSYIQPVINNFEFLRLTSVTTLEFTISSHLSFRSTFDITYDSRLAKEVPDVPYTIYSLSNGLRWSF